MILQQASFLLLDLDGIITIGCESRYVNVSLISNYVCHAIWSMWRQ